MLPVRFMLGLVHHVQIPVHGVHDPEGSSRSSLYSIDLMILKSQSPLELHMINSWSSQFVICHPRTSPRDHEATWINRVECFFFRCSPSPALPCSVCNNSKIFSLVSAKNSLEHHQWIINGVISGVSADREAILGSWQPLPSWMKYHQIIGKPPRTDIHPQRP